MSRRLVVFAGLGVLGALTVPVLPRAGMERVAPVVRALPWGELLARRAVERGLVADVDRLREPWPETCARQSTWPPPVATAVEGCEQASCTARDGGRVCSCWELWAEAPTMWVEDAAGARREEPGLALLRDDSFEVVQLDLDGDGQDERVIAALRAVSNGTPRFFWTLRVVGRGVEVPVADHGPASFVEDERGCALLATDWSVADDPWRGPGTYYVGQRWRLVGDALQPVGEPRARRLLERFHTTGVAVAGGGWRGEPSVWLREAQAWSGAVPGCAGQPLSSCTFPPDGG